MTHHAGPDPHLWDYVVHALQVLWTGAVLVAGWIWARLSGMQKQIKKGGEDLVALERIHLRDQISLHQQFATKEEVRSIIHEVATPIQESMSRIESKVDALISRHLDGNHK